jgi:phosphoglycerate kinase
MTTTINTTWKNHLVTDVTTYRGKRVLIRVDWNLPVTDGVVTDSTRLDVTITFLQKLAFAGAKIIIMSHFGEKGESLLPVAKYAHEKLAGLSFTQSLSFEELVPLTHSINDGEMLLLENVRLFPGETDNLPELVNNFAMLGDVFINDAFSVSHRKHASVVGVGERMLSYIGPTFARELEHLTNALSPEKPALLIVGGAKISTKLNLIKHYLDQDVRVFVGGAMVHNIWKSRGIEIGNSLYDPSYDLPSSLYNHPLLLTPIDVILDTGECVPYTNIPKESMVMDCGPETIDLVKNTLASSKTVILNGPLGLYEKGYISGSEGILRAVIDSHITSYAGGGDTVSVANKLGVLDKFTFTSLGGGAMLDFLASGTLPGIEAVTK